MLSHPGRKVVKKKAHFLLFIIEVTPYNLRGPMERSTCLINDNEYLKFRRQPKLPRYIYASFPSTSVLLFSPVNTYDLVSQMTPTGRDSQCMQITLCHVVLQFYSH